MDILEDLEIPDRGYYPYTLISNFTIISNFTTVNTLAQSLSLNAFHSGDMEKIKYQMLITLEPDVRSNPASRHS